MNLTFKELRCPKCGEKMQGFGGSFGGGCDHVKMRCHDCEFTLLIIPMDDDLRYEINTKPKL